MNLPTDLSTLPPCVWTVMKPSTHGTSPSDFITLTGRLLDIDPATCLCIVLHTEKEKYTISRVHFAFIQIIPK